MSEADPERTGDDFPVFDEDWIKDASRSEDSAEERADRYRRIARGHERINAQAEADRASAVKSSRRNSLRPWLILAAIAVAIMLVVFLI